MPAFDRTVVVLGDTPRSLDAFVVYRQGPGESEFSLLTPRPVRGEDDPYRAAELMGADFQWLASKIGSPHPPMVYRKLRSDRGRMIAYSFISYGICRALGRIYIDDDVVTGREYRYRIVFLDVSGREIGRFESQLRVGDPRRPRAPGSLSAEAGDKRVLLEWDYPAFSGDKEDTTVGFHLYRKDGGGEYRRLTPAPALRTEEGLRYVDLEVEEGGSYAYAVEAVDIIGTASSRVFSRTVRIEDNRPPLLPEGLTAVDTEEGVLLVWRMSPELDTAYYNVFRGKSLKEDEAFIRINAEPVAADKPRYIDAGINRGDLYLYRVTAVDSKGNESAKSAAVSITPNDSEAPPPVGGIDFKIDEGTRSVTLSWQEVEADDLLGYYVYRGSTEDKVIRISSEALEGQGRISFTDRGFEERGLPPGAVVYYQVSAVDRSLNESEPAGISVTIPDNVAPPPPISLSARPDKEGNVVLRWQPSLARDLAAHRVYRGTGRGFRQAAEVKGGETQWLDTEAEAGTRYFYRISAVDQAGNEGERSVQVSVVPTDIIPPGPPEDLKVTFRDGRVELSWQAPADEDTAAFIVSRQPYRGGLKTKLSPAPVEKRSFTDPEGRPGFIYFVAAVDRSGNTGAAAEGSAEEAEE
jgi:fibronectin type 3 domain-containing protein